MLSVTYGSSLNEGFHDIHGIRKIRILLRVRTKVLSRLNVQHVKRAAMNTNLLPQNQTQTKAMEAEARPQPLASLSVGQNMGELEVYEGVEIKKLQWSEDLFYLPNKYCPFCGRKFEFYEEVVEVTTNPIFVITGDKEADSIVIAIHLKCLIKDLKKGEEDE